MSQLVGEPSTRIEATRENEIEFFKSMVPGDIIKTEDLAGGGQKLWRVLSLYYLNGAVAGINIERIQPCSVFRKPRG